MQRWRRKRRKLVLRALEADYRSEHPDVRYGPLPEGTMPEYRLNRLRERRQMQRRLLIRARKQGVTIFMEKIWFKEQTEQLPLRFRGIRPT